MLQVKQDVRLSDGGRTHTPADHGSGRESRAGAQEPRLWALPYVQPAKMTPSGPSSTRNQGTPPPSCSQPLIPEPRFKWDHLGPAFLPAQPRQVPSSAPQLSLPTSPSICFPGPQFRSSEGLPCTPAPTRFLESQGEEEWRGHLTQRWLGPQAPGALRTGRTRFSGAGLALGLRSLTLQGTWV